jgi:2-methylisocitrate lyase-like PEP mutase family enzyme
VDRVAHFRRLHVAGDPLLVPNPWDVGTARILVSLGFGALATTSSGFAATLGRADGAVSRDEAIGHAGAIAAAVDVPVSADLEDGFAADPDGVAETIRGAVAAGLAGCSVEDYTRDPADPIHDLGRARERIAAAAEAAAGRLVLTARCENFLHGRPALDDTITRLVAYAEAGADVVYAPGLTTLEQIGAVLAAVERPLNVLLLPTTPGVRELAELGVHRISVGGALAYAAMAALADAAAEFRSGGRGLFTRAAAGREIARVAYA